MKFSIERQPFFSELQLVTRAAATRSAIPALGGVMLERPTDSLALSATDTEIALRRRIEADVAQEGTLLLPARLLLDIVRVADGDTVTIEAASDQGVVKVTSQRASFSRADPARRGLPEASRHRPPTRGARSTPARSRRPSSGWQRRPRVTRPGRS